MKISEKPTDTILVKARTNSQWDKCDFALIGISPDWCNRLMHRANEVKSLSGDQDFYCQIYWDTPLGYFRTDDGEEDTVSNYLSRQGRDWCFVTLDSAESEDLNVPENRLDCHQLVITASGNAHYKAYGKHSGEEFWTETFSITEVLGSLND